MDDPVIVFVCATKNIGNGPKNLVDTLSNRNMENENQFFSSQQMHLSYIRLCQTILLHKS